MRLARDMAPFDHRHPLAVLAVEGLRPRAHGEKDQEDAGKHADDEDDRKENIYVHGRLRLGPNQDCFTRSRVFCVAS